VRRRSPVFLARRAYRLRRLRDAARLLPLAGAFLLLLPILWEPAGGAARETAWDGVYLFVIWGLLIGAAAWLARGLVAGEDSDDDIAADTAIEAMSDSPPDSPTDGPAGGLAGGGR